MDAEFHVADNPAKGRYEALADGTLAGVVFYEEREGRLVLVHTQVREGWEGRGVGGRLVAGTLDDLRRRGLRVRVTCPFARAYLERHPEYADVVDE